MEGVVDFLRAGLLAPGDWQSIAFVRVEGHLPFFFPLLQLAEVFLQSSADEAIQDGVIHKNLEGDETLSGRSLMYTRNRQGLSTDPWRTPDLTLM